MRTGLTNIVADVGYMAAVPVVAAAVDDDSEKRNCASGEGVKQGEPTHPAGSSIDHGHSSPRASLRTNPSFVHVLANNSTPLTTADADAAAARHSTRRRNEIGPDPDPDHDPSD
jgi:hypothetical protein